MIFLACLALVVISPVSSIHCHADVDLNGLQEYHYAVPGLSTWAEMLSYWGNMQLNFQAFGTFKGNPVDANSPTTIEAGYYRKNGSLIYSIKVDCLANTWTSYITLNTTGDVTKYLDGPLDKACAEGDTFDIWFKVQQRFLMQWKFDGQSLQYEEHVTQYDRGLRRLRDKFGSTYIPSPGVKNRFRPLTLPVMHPADTADEFRLMTTGRAYLDRFTFGKCYAVPRELESNCTAANEWFIERKKEGREIGGPVGGQFGMSLLVFTPECAWFGSVYWSYLQAVVKPDENVPAGFGGSSPKAYCCCTDMRTGQIPGGPDGWADNCRIYCPNCGEICPLKCYDTFNSVLYSEEPAPTTEKPHVEAIES